MKIRMRLIVIAIISLTIHSCNSNTTEPKTVDELKQDLKVQEQISPTEYLSVKATLRENITQKADLFHHTKTDGYILSGSVKNSSTIAKFKDVVVQLTYLSETDTEIETKEFIMYKYFNPTSVTEFEYKVYPAPGFKNFRVQVTTATPAN